MVVTTRYVCIVVKPYYWGCCLCGSVHYRVGVHDPTPTLLESLYMNLHLTRWENRFRGVVMRLEANLKRSDRIGLTVSTEAVIQARKVGRLCQINQAV